MMRIAKFARSCAELIEEYNKNTDQSLMRSGILKFDAGDADVYNITAPITDGNEKYIAGRVESRDSEISKVWLFKQQGDIWVKVHGSPEFNRLQDPFYTRIGDEIIFGGVQIDTNPMDDRQIICWRTLFFRGKSFDDMRFFASGPNRMKDIRLFELKDGSIGVFTRPQGHIGGRGKIGYIRIKSLDDLNETTLNNARILNTHFIEEEWGGVNEVHPLQNGLFGALGHIACYDDNRNRHYHAMVFAFDPVTETHSPVKIIACRDNFMPSPAKRDDLRDVVFSGGLIRNGDGTAILYAGISDATAQWLILPDPFDEYEKCRYLR